RGIQEGRRRSSRRNEEEKQTGCRRQATGNWKPPDPADSRYQSPVSRIPFASSPRGLRPCHAPRADSHRPPPRPLPPTPAHPPHPRAAPRARRASLRAPPAPPRRRPPRGRAPPRRAAPRPLPHALRRGDGPRRRARRARRHAGRGAAVIWRTRYTRSDLTLANLFTFARIVLIPVSGWLWYHRAGARALWV